MENQLVIAVGSWAGGILAAVIVQQILNRRGVLSYFVQHQSLGISAEDSTFGNVKITWNDSPVSNLYLSTIELVNESSKDLQNVHVKAYSDDTILLTEFPHLVGTTECIKYSPAYQQDLYVPPGDSPTDRQLELYRKRREYIVPVMNRGQVVRFQYLNTSKTPEQPHIWIDLVHPGIVLKFRQPQTQVLGVPQPWASLAGAIAGIVFATILYTYSPFTWLTAFGCLIFGFFAQIPGAYTIRIIRVFRQWLSG